MSSLLGVHVERPDVLLLADRNALPRRRPYRSVVAKRTSPSTTLPARPRRRARAGSRDRNRGPLRPAYPRQTVSRIARSMSESPCRSRPPWRRLRGPRSDTRPISLVQVSVGEPLNGGGAIAFLVDRDDDRGEAAGSWLLPNTSQRSAVRMSMDRPWIGLSAGETEMAAQTNAMAATAIASRVLRLIFKMQNPMQYPARPIPCVAGDRQSALHRAWPAGRPGTRSSTHRMLPHRHRPAPGRGLRWQNRRTCP